MPFTNYGELKTEILTWYNRSDADFVSAIPSLVNMFETRFSRTMRLVRMEGEATLTQSGGQYALPSDLAQIAAVWDAGINPPALLSPVSRSFALKVSPQSGTNPGYYYTSGANLKIVPDNGANIGLRYYKKLDVLEGDLDTNWLLTEYPDIYLTGSLVQAALWDKDPDRAAIYSGQLNGMISELVNADGGLAWNESQMQIDGPTP